MRPSGVSEDVLVRVKTAKSERELEGVPERWTAVIAKSALRCLVPEHLDVGLHQKSLLPTVAHVIPVGPCDRIGFGSEARRAFAASLKLIDTPSKPPATIIWTFSSSDRSTPSVCRRSIAHRDCNISSFCTG
jgi:hypothetical protein